MISLVAASEIEKAPMVKDICSGVKGYAYKILKWIFTEGDNPVMRYEKLSSTVW